MLVLLQFLPLRQPLERSEALELLVHLVLVLLPFLLLLSRLLLSWLLALLLVALLLQLLLALLLVPGAAAYAHPFGG